MQNGSYHNDSFYNPVRDQWLNLSCKAMRWHGREAVALYAVDVTEEKKRQISAEIDRKSLELLVSNTPIGIGVCTTREGRVIPLAVNDRFGELLGAKIDTDSHTNLALLSRVHPDDREMLGSKMQQLEKENVHIRLVFRYDPTLCGVFRWLQIEAKTILQNHTLLAFACLSDVTAEKEAETEREKNRRMYEAAVEDVNLVVWEYDIPARRVVMADNEFTHYDHRKFGLPKVMENVPDSLIPYIEDTSVGKFLDMYRAVDAGAPKASCEVWYKWRPGQEPRCERISYTTVFDREGHPVTALGIGLNITARKLEEEKYNRFYKQLTKANPDTLGSFRMNLTRNWCGDGQSPQPDYLSLQESGTVDGFFAAMAERLVEGEARDSFRRFFTRKNLLQAFQEGRPQITQEFPFILSERGVKWGRGSISMVQNPVTGDVEALTYTQDITEHKKEELIAQRLTNEMIDYIGLIDVEKHTFEFRNVNRLFPELPVRKKADYGTFVGDNSKTFVIPADRNAFQANTSLGHLTDELAGSPSYSFTYGHTEGGIELRKHLQYAYLDDTRSEILVIQSDVTDLYHQEQQQLRQTKEALQTAEQANHAKTEFLSRISHDIRTPISIISSMTDFAQEDLGDSEKLKNDISKIKTANQFLLSLINDVLDISKIDSGKISLTPEPYPYDEYIANIRNMFEPLCEKKGIEFTASEKTNSGVILADKIRLNQIVLNLLSNAVKYTPAGGKVSYLSKSRDLPDGTVLYAFEISDTGIGMSEAFQKTMFEPFTQEYDNPNRPKAQSGTGLGLSIVKRMVDLMGGTLSVRSQLGKGTAVYCEIHFPNAYPGSRQDEQAEREEHRIPRRTGLTGKLILAEDNEINAEIALRILQELGLTVDRAENGEEAAELFRLSAPGTYRAILMDIQMPVLNGYEATRAIRAMRRPDAASIPILAMTADAFTDAMERGYAAGMNEYITKPIHPDRLADVLARALSSREISGDGSAAKPE